MDTVPNYFNRVGKREAKSWRATAIAFVARHHRNERQQIYEVELLWSRLNVNGEEAVLKVIDSFTCRSALSGLPSTGPTNDRQIASRR